MSKIIFISSTGGHLTELRQLEDLFQKNDSYLVTEKTKNNKSLIKKYQNRIKFLCYGTKHNMLIYPFICIYNILKSMILYFKIHPDYIITTGAHTCVPMCYIGKIFGSKIIYIETFANIHTKTLTGKLIYPISDVFIVQWKEMLDLYPKAKYWGWIF